MQGRRSWLVALALVALTLAAYWPVLGNGFVNYDDDLYITGRPEVLAGLSGEGTVWAFTSSQGANWFPLTRLSWMLDAELHGPDPSAFHATSLALHLVNVVLLLWALLRMTGQLWPSAFVAAVFALHPLHVESVAWASARKDVLSGLFFMLALLVHAQRTRGARPLLWSVLLCTALAFGLMAKPMLVTLPLVLLLLDEWPLGRLRDPSGKLEPARLRAALLEKLPLFAVAVVAGVATLWAQRAGGALQALERYPLADRVGNALDSLLQYGVQVFWPTGLAAFYPHPHGSLPVWRVAVGAFLLVGISTWALRSLRRQPWLAVGWFWFVGMLVPVSGLVQVGQAARADRYTYLPLVGLAIAVAWGAREWLARHGGYALGIRRAAVAVVLLLALTTHTQVLTWRDSASLFEHALRVTEGNHVAHINLGLARYEAGRFEEAEEHLTQALVVAPASSRAWGLRAAARRARGRGEEAVGDFRAALRLDPQSARWQRGLARALLETDRVAEADAALQRFLAVDAAAGDLNALRGQALFRLGRREEAELHFRRALQTPEQLERGLGPGGTAFVHARLGGVLAARGQHQEALGQLDQALGLDPENAELHGNRAALLEAQGREAEAVSAYREALRLGDRSPRALNNLAWLLAAADDASLHAPEEAVGLAEEAVELTEGEDPNVLDTLAAAYAAAGRRPEAFDAASRAVERAEAQGRKSLAASLRARLGGYRLD